MLIYRYIIHNKYKTRNGTARKPTAQEKEKTLFFCESLVDTATCW